MSQECWLLCSRCGLKEMHLKIQMWVKRGLEIVGVCIVSIKSICMLKVDHQSKFKSFTPVL